MYATRFGELAGGTPRSVTCASTDGGATWSEVGSLSADFDVFIDAQVSQLDADEVVRGQAETGQDAPWLDLRPLALAGVEPFHDIAGDPDLLSRTGFDLVYYPTENQEHIAITPENKQWMIAEIGAGVSTVPQPGPAQAGAVQILKEGARAEKVKVLSKGMIGFQKGNPVWQV